MNVDVVVQRNLCSGCSICAAICPKDAIKMTLDQKGFPFARIVREQCSNCRLCLDVCPFANLYANHYSADEYLVVHPPSYNWNIVNLLGLFINVYLGYARDDSIRLIGSSGGIATALVLFLLENKYVDAALIPHTIIKPNGIVYNISIPTKSRFDIVRNAGSKYAPTFVHEALRFAIKHKLKFVFVGLPCQIRAVAKAEEKIPILRDLAVLKIGLYCNNLPSAFATKYIYKLFGIDPQSVVGIRYRGFGWPGFMILNLKNGKIVKIPFESYWNSGFGQYFMNRSCLLCKDHTAEFADISLADPWSLYVRMADSKRDANIRLKYSIIVTRTPRGEKILKETIRHGYIVARSINPVYAIQPTTVSKKRSCFDFLWLSPEARKRGRRSCTFSPISMLWLLEYIIGSSLSRNEKLWYALYVYFLLLTKIKHFLRNIFKDSPFGF